jgi:hypothetical protein
VTSAGAYDLSALARLRARGGCGCHEPAPAKLLAERVARTALRRRVRDGETQHEAALARAGAEPVVIAASDGSRCRPFFTVQHDQERFAACNVLADEIGRLDDPKRAARLIGEAIGAEANEVFGLVTLDIHLRYKSMALTGRGEAAAVMAPMVPTLQVSLIDAAHAVILFHVHPSGVEAEPSDADKETTEAFAEAFETINVGLLDHVIVGRGGRSYFSFYEAKLLPPLADE